MARIIIGEGTWSSIRANINSMYQELMAATAPTTTVASTTTAAPTTTSAPTTTTLGVDYYGYCSNITADTNILASYIWYFQVTIAVGGSITNLSTYVGTDIGNSPCGLKTAVYADNGSNAPGALLTNGIANTISLTFNSSNNITFPISPSVSNTTKYWIAFKIEKNNYMQKGAGSILTKYEDAVYTNAFPATATPLAYSARDLKVCVEVTH